jgi:hypothetical protein
MQKSSAAAQIRTSAPAWSIAGAIALLVCVVGVLAYQNFAPRDVHVGESKTAPWLAEVARYSGGDYDKVKPADKMKLSQIPFINPRDLVKKKYESLPWWGRH